MLGSLRVRGLFFYVRGSSLRLSLVSSTVRCADCDDGHKIAKSRKLIVSVAYTQLYA